MLSKKQAAGLVDRVDISLLTLVGLRLSVLPVLKRADNHPF